MSTIKKLMMTAAGGEALAIEDVFSTYLWNYASGSLTVSNGIDLAGEGGLVWIKGRTSNYHWLHDSERPLSQGLHTNTSDKPTTNAGSVTSFNSDGFTTNGPHSGSVDHASWTFRKAPRFFDVVTYTGDGTAGRTISHNLGSTPATIIVKSTDITYNWAVYHKDLNGGTNPENYYILLNSTAAEVDNSAGAQYWGAAPTSTEFTVGAAPTTNRSGYTYVAYLFAHDPLGPSGDGSDGLIACGSYTGDGTTNGTNEVTLGWEPQWILTKRSDSADNWHICDVMRRQTTDGITQRLRANTSAGESLSYGAVPTPTGFKLYSDNSSGGTFIYIAIRRGPMRQPESGTEVFDIDLANPGYTAITTSFPVDLSLGANRSGSVANFSAIDRLRGGKGLRTNASDAEQTITVTLDSMNSFSNAIFGSGEHLFYSWKRAPGFFDMVAYTGNGVAGRTVPHNLGVAPEMIIQKGRDTTFDWQVLVPSMPSGQRIQRLNEVSGFGSGYEPLFFGDGSVYIPPTSTEFTLASPFQVNGSGKEYIAYLFATLPGVSKVGSYTGNGTSQTIDCGFTSGARFVLIKRTNNTGDWYVWDTERGIVAANDPHLSPNTTAAEVTTDDSVDPDSSGFIVNQVAATNINVSSATYIFYAIA